MIRALHRWPGLLALALLTILALSGAALSVFPAVERLAAPQADAGLSVAELAARIRAARDAGCEIVATETGDPVGEEKNQSLRNIRRAGFQWISSRLNFRNPPTL
jgi:hypothetical protein